MYILIIDVYYFLAIFFSHRPFDKTTDGMELDVHAGAASSEQVGHAGGSTVIIGGGAPVGGAGRRGLAPV